MYYEIYAKTAVGGIALMRYWKDSQCIKGKFLARVERVTQGPMTVRVTIRTLKTLPQETYENEVMQKLVEKKTIETMKAYGAERSDYDIRG